MTGLTLNFTADAGVLWLALAFVLVVATDLFWRIIKEVIHQIHTEHDKAAKQ